MPLPAPKLRELVPANRPLPWGATLLLVVSVSAKPVVLSRIGPAPTWALVFGLIDWIVSVPVPRPAGLLTNR